MCYVSILRGLIFQRVNLLKRQEFTGTVDWMEHKPTLMSNEDTHLETLEGTDVGVEQMNTRWRAHRRGSTQIR